jgi:hypothetical protein
MYRNSASPAASDDMGQLLFTGKDSGGAIQTYAYIQSSIGSPTAAAEDGYLSFWTVGSGSITEKVRILGNGNVGIGKTSPTCALDVSGGISTGSSSVTSPATTDGNIFSGTYTPTLTGVTNVASSTAYITSYMRVGNVVTVAGRIAIDPTATGQTSIGMSLPIASTLGATQTLGGTFAFGADSGQVGAISGDATNNRASFDILTNSAANRSYYFSFTYRVI